MRTTDGLLLLTVLVAAGAAGATPTMPAPVQAARQAAVVAPIGPLPRGLAGYAQPVIPASFCRVVSAAEAQCAIPAMTAGRYLVEATGTSTSQGADAAQALEIDVGGRQCGVAKNTKPWTSGPRTFRMACEVTFMTDSPIAVRVQYADAKAVKDPKGPTVSIRPLPWNGVLSVQPFVPQQ